MQHSKSFIAKREFLLIYRFSCPTVPFPQEDSRGRQDLYGVKSPFSAKSGCPLRCRQIRPMRLVYPCPSQCLQRRFHQLRRNAPTTILQMYRRVVDVSPAPVIARQDHAHDLPAFLCNKAGVGIAPQKASDAVLGVIQIVQPHAFTGVP